MLEDGSCQTSSQMNFGIFIFVEWDVFKELTKRVLCRKVRHISSEQHLVQLSNEAEFSRPCLRFDLWVVDVSFEGLLTNSSFVGNTKVQGFSSTNTA